MSKICERTSHLSLSIRFGLVGVHGESDRLVPIYAVSPEVRIHYRLVFTRKHRAPRYYNRIAPQPTRLLPLQRFLQALGKDFVPDFHLLHS